MFKTGQAKPGLHSNETLIGTDSFALGSLQRVHLLVLSGSLLQRSPDSFNTSRSGSAMLPKLQTSSKLTRLETIVLEGQEAVAKASGAQVGWKVARKEAADMIRQLLFICCRRVLTVSKRAFCQNFFIRKNLRIATRDRSTGRMCRCLERRPCMEIDDHRTKYRHINRWHRDW